jgi:hypothetical protein
LGLILKSATIITKNTFSKNFYFDLQIVVRVEASEEKRLTIKSKYGEFNY